MNYAELKTQIRFYMQRTDITSLQIDEAMERARVKIGADLRTKSNLRFEDVSVTDGVGSIPGSFVEMLHVTDVDNNPLQPVAPDRFWTAFESGGSKALYYLVDSRFRVAPKTTATYTLEYYYSPTGITSNDANTVPSVFDELYIPLVCADLFAGFHNWQASQYHEARYQGLVERRNRQWAARVQPARRVRNYESYQGAL